MKVLIIDDDSVARKVISKYLADHHTIETATSGDSGVALAQGSLPDVVLLDVEMPGKNGYQVCDILRQSPATRDIPVLFLSSRERCTSDCKATRRAATITWSNPATPMN